MSKRVPLSLFPFDPDYVLSAAETGDVERWIRIATRNYQIQRVRHIGGEE